MTTLAVKVGANLDVDVAAVTFTLRTGATLAGMAATALSCAVSSVATFCTDTDSIAMNAGDLFTLRVTYDDGSNSGANVFINDLVCE
jgi:hypothetical protein